MNAPLIIITIISVVVIGAVLIAVMIMTRGQSNVLIKEGYRTEWLKIENGLDKNNPATYQFAILAADKLLDQALCELGVSGDDMGDRLKASKGRLASLSGVCTAHKLRNQIAYKADTSISLLNARRVLATYKKALKELEAI
ncbi:hypothetical protein FWC31_02330 [Candidatus Saccharibacteria bacterium]|nr:hypothetical protein [Candidatus Saccharibacteria bacterium]